MTDKDIQANYEILENVSKNIEINILIKKDLQRKKDYFQRIHVLSKKSN